MILVTKSDGSKEKFRATKLRASLKLAGASPDEIKDIVRVIESKLCDGIKTEAIYRHAFTLLRQSGTVGAARYSVRRSLFGLGPTGFPFEDFLGRLFVTEGYTTKTRLTVKGKCVEHEIDVAAFKPGHSFVAEAKFHARPGLKSDLQVVLYSYARFLDLKAQKICAGDVCGVSELRLITNTKFTSTAIKYAQCVGVNLIAWEYPKVGNLHDMIVAAKIFPITVLSSLSAKQKQILISKKAIICSDVVARPHILRSLHLSKRKFEAVQNEASRLSNQI